MIRRVESGKINRTPSALRFIEPKSRNRKAMKNKNRSGVSRNGFMKNKVSV